MIESEKSKTNLKRKIHIDTISKDKMHFRVVNHYPEIDFKISKNIENNLFKIFKKYEHKDI